MGQCGAGSLKLRPGMGTSDLATPPFAPPSHTPVCYINIFCWGRTTHPHGPERRMASKSLEDSTQVREGPGVDALGPLWGPVQGPERHSARLCAEGGGTMGTHQRGRGGSASTIISAAGKQSYSPDPVDRPRAWFPSGRSDPEHLLPQASSGKCRCL